jgi:hypothetical protein
MASMAANPSEPTTIIGTALASAIHLGYLTNDTTGAVEHFEAAGIGPWKTIDVVSDERSVRGSFAFMKGRMFEVIEPLTDSPPIFPLFGSDGLEILFHHVGTFMDVDSELIVQAAQDAGMEFHRTTREQGDIVFVDTRETTGHWLEVLCFANAQQ